MSVQGPLVPWLYLILASGDQLQKTKMAVVKMDYITVATSVFHILTDQFLTRSRSRFDSEMAV